MDEACDAMRSNAACKRRRAFWDSLYSLIQVSSVGLAVEGVPTNAR